MFKAILGTRKSALDFMTQNTLEKKLCKYNQVSDWDCRPLRQGQLHYAGLDAYILIEIYKNLKIIICWYIYHFC